MCVHCLPSAKICQPRSSGSAQVASRFRAVYLHLFDSPLLFVCLFVCLVTRASAAAAYGMNEL